MRRLEERAKAAGRSAEAELRAILEDVLRPKMTGAQFWQEIRDSGPLLTDEEVEMINNASNEPVRYPDFSE